MDGARLKQKRICKCFRKNISGILAYVRQSNATQKQTFKKLHTLASTHAYTGGGLPCAFLKIETILKNFPENTLVNCITQPFSSLIQF